MSYLERLEMLFFLRELLFKVSHLLLEAFSLLFTLLDSGTARQLKILLKLGILLSNLLLERL